MQAVVKLALKRPLELGMIEIARMESEVVGMHRNWRILELNYDFYPITVFTSSKIEQGVLIKTELGEDTIKTGAGRSSHQEIVKELRLTTLLTEEYELFVTQCFDGIEPCCLDGGQHPTDDAYHAEDSG